MPEQPNPLTNDELATYHSQVVGAQQSYDPDQRDTFVRPQDVWAHEASNEFVFHRIRHATEAEQDLVTQHESGRHELSFDSLTADFDQVGKFVQEDIDALAEAIRDPAKVREAWWAKYDSTDGRAWRPTLPRGSKSALTLEEAKYFLDDRDPVVPGDETEALRTVSLRVTEALLESWKYKQYRGHKTPDDRDIPLYLEFEHSGRTNLGRHLERGHIRERTEQHFRSVHRDHVARLGRAAANAAGVRRSLNGDVEDVRTESSEGTTLAERRKELTQQQREQIVHSPVEVRRIIARVRSDYVNRMLVPVQRRATADPSGKNKAMLARLEGKIADIGLLYRFVKRWQSQLEDGNEIGFDEYMTTLARERETESGQFAEIDARVTDDVKRRRAEFDGAYYGVYSSPDAYSFTGWLDRAAYGRANQQLQGQRAA